MAITLVEQSAASVSTPASGEATVYVDATSGALSFKDDAAAVHTLSESAGAAITTLTDGATVTWTVTGKKEDMAQLTIAGARTLAITGASAGFRGVIHITESGASRSLALPANSIVVNGGAGVIALTGSSGGKQKWTVSYDGTNYWWEAGPSYT